MGTPRSTVPALDRGLQILDLALSADHEISFSEITRELGVAKASASRLIKVLCQRGYLHKNPTTARYHPGQHLAAPSTVPDRLKRLAGPALHRLADLTGNTVLLLHWDGERCLCLERATSEDSLAMQSPGHIARNLFDGPWGWFMLASLAPTAQTTARIECGLDASCEAISQAGLARYAELGYVQHIDRERERRRVAAPLFDEHGNLVGCLGMGGTRYSLSDRMLNDQANALAEEARRISSALGWTGTTPSLHLSGG
ncbi:MAG: helix-turn-helix domain-containing protein [Planctomycetota bacterium]|jgi:IclR family KDG regulon transcriptional repressor|nr:helix-turn-helix domain-containing protein [Planctomycetota bacterium]